MVSGSEISDTFHLSAVQEVFVFVFVFWKKEVNFCDIETGSICFRICILCLQEVFCDIETGSNCGLIPLTSSYRHLCEYLLYSMKVIHPG